MNTQIIQELANKDMMPATDVVQDFYETEEIEPSSADRWEQVPEHLLADLNVPGYPKICPYKAWHVVTDTGIWMIYHWYEEPFGTNDDVWIYAGIKGKRLEMERTAYDFQDAMNKILNLGK
jgi:hypothetical protein